jgi:hypothetical protein
LIRRRTLADRAAAFVRKLNAPREIKKRRVRVEATLRQQVLTEFREAARIR